jgi:hypothetical protein
METGKGVTSQIRSKKGLKSMCTYAQRVVDFVF